ncbi:heptaprenyl diphosphate synthase component 1 [Metabacillus elymi]|uniref:Heptaprenyl diphosphate synthase component 1 n=1 Tax=Metabacillus elymi TaxID=2745198 RepID=A0ABX6SAQ1_9BACI|nr:heptaprenyl diphosphate synthase component 1 [Metabacillus sp. KUDC1714]QNF30677.1 heptaprenyl diphosphate synthase component 1 [Metabacillus sp. KUDC1714]
MQDIYVKLAKMKIALEEKLTHPFLGKYLPLPKIDEDKLLLFCAIFDEIDLSEELKESYILTAMLVQIALDTHDDVTTHNNINSTEFVQRQLTVLAGDYFSGLYYFMLSEVKDFKMVRTLAVAIKQINEHKIRLYHDDEVNIQSIMDSLLIVETALFQRVAEHFNLDRWKLISTKFLIYKRLSHEKFQIENESNIPENQKYEGMFSGNYLKRVCNMYFEETSSLLESGFLKTPAIKNLLHKRLQSIRFYETLHYKKTVEEGL